MSCLDETDVALFFEGRLEVTRIEEMERHLDGCNTCLQLVAAAGPALDGDSAGAGPRALLRVGDLLAGRYEIRAVLGAGATGYVYRAHDHLVDSAVALKVLRPAFADDPACVRTFVAELQVARRLIHPNVCRVYDLQQAEGHTYLTMELASGGSLRDEIVKRPERPLAGRLKDALSLTRGLAAMHAVGLVHRDVKPGNVLRAADGRIMLSDFGLAFVSAIAGNPARPVGTPAYIPPEVAAGAPAGPRSDVWSLGVTLHELFFGEKPGAAKGVPNALQQLLRDCLADDPERRPADGSAVLARLLRVQQGPPPRRRWPALALAAGIAATAAGGAALVARRAGHPPPEEVTLTLTFAPPKNQGGVTPAQMQEVAAKLERVRARLQGTPYLRVLAQPPARPGVDDWTLELWVESESFGAHSTFWVRNGEGTRRNLGSAGGAWDERRPGQAGPPFLPQQLVVFADDVRRWRWAERGTDRPAARAAMKTLLERPTDRLRMPPSVARGLLDQALAEDARYLAAHVEGALVSARLARAPAGRSVDPAALLAEEEALGRRAPAEPRALVARCRLLEAAARIDAEPSQAQIDRAIELCRRASGSPGIGEEAWLSLAWLQALTCQPQAALESLQRALAWPSRQTVEVLQTWAALALREHLPQAEALDAWARQPAVVLASRAYPDGDRVRPPLALAVGSLWLRQGSTGRARESFQMIRKLGGVHDPDQEAALAEGIARAEADWLPRPEPPPPGTAGAHDGEIADLVARAPQLGHAAVETLSWTAPERAKKLLRTLPPAGTCTQAIDRASLRRALGDVVSAEAALPTCRSRAPWVERCRQHLRQPPGVANR
jgi:serine/threonine protein kinase